MILNKELPYFFERLNKNRISYSVLRNYEYLPESTDGSDLDILVYEKSEAKFMLVLQSFMKSHHMHIVSFIEDEYCPKICILNTNWGIQMDVFKGAVRFGHKEIISSELLFKHTKDYQGVQVLDSKVGSLLAFLKELLNNKDCSEKYIINLQNQFYNEEIKIQLLSQFKPEFHSYLNKYLKKLDDHHLIQLYQIAKKDFKRFRWIGLKNKIKRLYRKPGYTTAFLGTDGAGKSTIIESIKLPLNDAFHKAVYYEHMRPNKFPSIARLLGKKEEFSGPVTDPHGSEPSGFVGSLLRWAYYLLDYTLGYYLKVYPKKAIRSCVWLFDRYYYDYLIDPKRGRINLPKWILKFGQFIIPEPDIIICLGADAATIHKRKPELPLAEVERQVHALKVFSATNKRAVWIDTGTSVEVSSQKTLKAIINVMAKRFESINLS